MSRMPASGAGAWILVGLLAAGDPLGAGGAAARTFTQEAVGYRADGSPLAVTAIDPDALPQLTTSVHALGRGRSLEIRTNLPVERGAEVDALAGVVQRCYAHLEQATGRRIAGGVLLYLLQYPRRPECYRFEVEIDDDEGWSQVRVALLDAGQPLLGPGASDHVTGFVYDTLPHELAHGLLLAVPTVRHDLDGQPPQGTRWFIEGVCEKLAKDFAAGECASCWRAAVQARRPGSLLDRPGLGDLVWRWGQAGGLSWSDDCDLYGVSLLLVSAWTEQVPLRDLLALLASGGGDVDGPGLLAALAASADLDQPRLLARARQLGAAWSRGDDLSQRIVP